MRRLGGKHVDNVLEASDQRGVGGNREEYTRGGDTHRSSGPSFDKSYISESSWRRFKGRRETWSSKSALSLTEKYQVAGEKKLTAPALR